jgi:tetrahydromethanopterin:alpha-L-glutamate ligase
MRPSPESALPRSTPSRLCVGLVADSWDWHARELAKALDPFADSVAIKLEACGFDTESACGLTIPGCDSLPDAVLVRSLSGGTFEAVTKRLGVLHALREVGVLVWNNAKAIERCVDKSTTSFLLARAGIATPRAWTTESRETACEIVRRECTRGPVVLKPLFGSQGRGLRLIRHESELPEPDAVAGIYYLQRFVGVEEEGGFRDFRLLVSQQRVIAAMARHAPGWITNVKQGGRPLAAVVDDYVKDLAVVATTAVGASFAGVDILFGADGKPTVLEVNSMPAWSGLQKVAPVSVATALAGDLVVAVQERAARRMPA